MSHGVPDDSCAYLCSHTANRSKFKINDEDPRQNPYPVNAMETLNSATEVWYSNGPGILVLDCTTMEIVKRLEPYNPPSMVVSIACGSECNGEEVAWCLDDTTNFLLMYYTATYQLCARYFCGDCSPLRDTFTVLQPSALIPSTLVLKKTVGPKSHSLVDVSIMHSQELGTQILNYQDSLTDYCSVSSSFPSSRDKRTTRSSSSLPNSPTSSSSSLCFPTDFEQLKKHQELNSPPENSENDLASISDSTWSFQAVTILPVKDLIWIPR